MQLTFQRKNIINKKIYLKGMACQRVVSATEKNKSRRAMLRKWGGVRAAL